MRIVVEQEETLCVYILDEDSGNISKYPTNRWTHTWFNKDKTRGQYTCQIPKDGVTWKDYHFRELDKVVGGRLCTKEDDNEKAWGLFLLDAQLRRHNAQIDYDRWNRVYELLKLQDEARRIG